MGTLSIKLPSNVFSIAPNVRSNGVTAGWWNVTSGLNTDAALIAGLEGVGATVCRHARGSGDVTFKIVFAWDAADAIFSLDGGAYKTLAQLPNGFLMNVVLKSWLQDSNCGSPVLAYSLLATLYNTITVSPTTTGAAIDFTELTNPGIPVPSIAGYIGASQFLDQSLIYQEIVDTSACGGVAVDNYTVLSHYILTGTYLIYANAWTITATNPTYVGRRVTFTADVTNPANNSFEFVDRVTFSYPTTDSSGNSITRNIEIYKNYAAFSSVSGSDDNIDIGGGINLGGNPVRYINSPAGYVAIRPEEFIFGYAPYIIEWGLLLITIVIPFGFDDYTGDVEVSGYVNNPDGVQFSGSVSLGTLTIAYADASGIYAIVPNKGNDTLYDPARDGSTVDVTIPRPSAKTGFIGG